MIDCEKKDCEKNKNTKKKQQKKPKKKNNLISVSAPKVKLVAGGKNFGRVVVEIDGRSGLVIDKDWSNKEAQVVCKEIDNDYVGGEVYRYFFHNPRYAIT